MLPLLGGLISAGAGLLGGMMNNNAQKDVNQANIAATEKANAENIALQKEFAQHGLRWKTEDAKRAGIHPLYAIGAPSVSFAPSSVGSTSMHDPSMGNAIAQGGADIGRAIASTSTDGERMNLMQESIAALQLERGSLENELLRTQIRRLTTEAGPSFPSSSTSEVPGGISTPFGNLTLGPHTPAQDVTNEYGEVVGEGAGISRFFHDMTQAAAAYLANPPSNRPPRLPGEPKRPTNSGPLYPHLGTGYNRQRPGF